MFSDGSDVFHSDYFSGWDEAQLQTVLDGCENNSESADPTDFCSSWLTYRSIKEQSSDDYFLIVSVLQG